jgi:hypothetical protein
LRHIPATCAREVSLKNRPKIICIFLRFSLTRFRNAWVTLCSLDTKNNEGNDMSEGEFKKILWMVALGWLAVRYLFPIFDSTLGKYLPASA